MENIKTMENCNFFSYNNTENNDPMK